MCLLGGLDKSAFKISVLFYTMPDPSTCKRVEYTGGNVLALYPHDSDAGTPRQFKKLSLQVKIQKIFGERGERFYESLKYVVYYLRFRWPIYRALKRKVSKVQPDLVHLNSGVVADTPGMFAARACRVPAICHVRVLNRVSFLSVRASRFVDTFVCISTAVRDGLIGYGIRADRCTVVPNAVDTKRFNEATITSSTIRSEFGWTSSQSVFILVGRVVYWKGQDYFIEAMAKARVTDPGLRGLIVGGAGPTPDDHAYMARLQARMAELGLDDIVKFTGHRTDVPNIMKDADGVICASSLPEPFGRVIIESMAVGTPVVATNAGGATDIVEDGVNGMLVPTKDSDAIAAAMLRLSQDEAFAEDLCAEGLRAVAERYTIAHHAEEISKIYQSVLGTA